MARRTLGGLQLWADRRWRGGWRVQENVLDQTCRLVDPSDRLHQAGSLEDCEVALESVPVPVASGPGVLLLHGLGRTRRSLIPLARALGDAGFEPICVGYPSTRRGVGEHAAQLVDFVAHLPAELSRLSFVTHSLGGIIARAALAHPRWPLERQPERLVMMAPPSQGSRLARRLDSALFRTVMGPAAAELAGPLEVPPPFIPFAIIAGSQRRGHGRNPLLRGDDDGIVSVDETRLAGSEGVLVVESLHTFIMRHPEAVAAAVRFLAGGSITR